MPLVRLGKGDEMRKKLPLLLVVLAVLAVGYFFLTGLPYDLLSEDGPEAPAKASQRITLSKEGSYPGDSLTPVSPEAGQPYEDLMAALREQKYRPILPFSQIPDGGLAVYRVASGCTPVCMLYWDGEILWLYQSRGRWQGYRPTSPEILGDKLATICNS